MEPIMVNLPDGSIFPSLHRIETPIGVFRVFAGALCAQDAIDEWLDYLEKNNPGMFLSGDEEDELTDVEREETVNGGGHGRCLRLGWHEIDLTMETRELQEHFVRIAESLTLCCEDCFYVLFLPEYQEAFDGQGKRMTAIEQATDEWSGGRCPVQYEPWNDEFSRSACGCCGSTLGGKRYGVGLLP